METLYRFGDYRVDVAARRVDRGAEAVPLEPRPFELLLHLIRERRRVVTKEELLARVWRAGPVSDAAVARALMKLRRAITAPDGSELIRTVARVGYRFVAPLWGDEADAPAAAAAVPALAVLPVENATGEASLAWLELGLMALAVRELEGHALVRPAAIPSVMAAWQGARAAGLAPSDAAVRRATGAGIVVRARVLRGDGSALRLVYAARGAVVFRGVVVSARPAELATRFADALVQALHPTAAPPQPRVRRDPLADEAFARALQAMTGHRWAHAANLLGLALDLEPERLDAQLELLRAQGNLGDDGLVARAHRLLAQAEAQGDRWLAARVHQALGRLYLVRSELAQADHHLDLSLRCAAGQGSADWTARTLMLQAGVAANRLDHPRTLAIVRRMYEQCERSGDRLLPVAGLNFEANAMAFGGDLEGAVRLSLEAARRARALHAHSYLFDALDNAAWYFVKLGRLADAAGQAEEAIAGALSLDHVANAWRSVPLLCWIYRLAGAPAAARSALERMPAPPVPCPEHEARARAHLAAAEGRYAEAADDMLRALAILREQGHAYEEEQTLPWLVDALLLAGRLDEAQAELDGALGPRLSGSPDLKAHVLHARAWLAHARGRADAARAGLAALADSDAAPMWRGRACIDLAWLEAEAGRSPEASRVLARVPPVLHDHPRVLALQARLREPPRPRDTVRAAPLPSR